MVGPLIRAERGMRCIITVEARNRSGGSVHLDHALLPCVGPRGGAVMKVDTTADACLWSTTQGDHRDILRLLDVTLSPGDSTNSTSCWWFRENGCSGGPEGGQTWFGGFPTVTITSLGRTVDRPALDDLAHSQVSRPAAACRWPAADRAIRTNLLPKVVACRRGRAQ